MPRIDLTGQMFGRLTVIERAGTYTSPKGYRSAVWRCRCECGTEVMTRTSSLRTGNTKSCGCLKRDNIVIGRREEAHPQWLGSAVSYKTAHQRTRRKRGSATAQACTDCGNRAADWSYVGDCPDELPGMTQKGHLARYCPVGNIHEGCYVPRCKPCHMKYDEKEDAA